MRFSREDLFENFENYLKITTWLEQVLANSIAVLSIGLQSLSAVLTTRIYSADSSLKEVKQEESEYSDETLTVSPVLN